MENTLRGLRYNSEQENLIIPEYGRHIQNLVEHAIALDDDKERLGAANTIIRLMAQVSGQGKPGPDIEQKLWRHLFIISDYKINVHPEGIELPKIENKDLKPATLTYPRNTKSYRHYGAYVQELINKALEEEDEEKRKGFFSSIASYMKTAYKVWNRDPHIGDELIITDLKALIGGRGELPEELDIVSPHIKLQPLTTNNNKNKRRRKNGNGKKNNNSNNRRRKR